MLSACFFTQKPVIGQQESTIFRIKHDPAYRTDIALYKQIKNGSRDACVIVPDGQNTFKFISKTATFEEEGPTYEQFAHPKKYVVIERKLVVNNEGVIEIFKEDMIAKGSNDKQLQKVDEDIYLYLFSEQALALIKHIKKLNFYTENEQVQPDELAMFSYRSNVLKNVNVLQPNKAYAQVDMLVGIYQLFIDRKAEVNHVLEYYTPSGQHSIVTFANVDKIPDPAVRKFHHKHIESFLTHFISKNNSPEKLKLTP